ncbi:hypothetical protein FHT08_003934 [Xanthomonas campestris]|nr:hypothetical protein [Xanthomonas sp. CFBP 8152]NIJ78793.1 hypothetical protein [Xanthomonas sp. CFBP 8151]
MRTNGGGRESFNGESLRVQVRVSCAVDQCSKWLASSRIIG